ncbi:hypothetical protein lerEdw1_015929 [Lerista edwardsae]|nr:hypothetical protein lerEdw1_015929 [Lerista edwardsae]
MEEQPRKMFAKLKKKVAEEAAAAPRPGGAARMPRSVSKESITSVGADSGDDFPSDGSSSREDLSSQLFRRNQQIRKLEVKLSDYAEQVRNLQKIKEKLEIALEKHQDCTYPFFPPCFFRTEPLNGVSNSVSPTASMRKLQEQNEAHQASRAKMAEGMALALEKKDQEWREKVAHLEKASNVRASPEPTCPNLELGPQERKLLSAQLQEMREQSLNLFQKRDELDELEGFQQQELAKVKHMLLQKEESLAHLEREREASAQELAHTREKLQAASARSSRLASELQELRQQREELEAERDGRTEAEESAESKITALEQRGHELQAFIQRLSVDLQNAQASASGCEKRLATLQVEHESLRLEYEQHKQKAQPVLAAVEEKDRLIRHLQEKVSLLEKRLQGDLSGDEHVRELLKEKSALEQRLEESRQQLLTARTGHTESLSHLETQVRTLSGQVADRQALLSEKEDCVRSLQESSLQQVVAARAAPPPSFPRPGRLGGLSKPPEQAENFGFLQQKDHERALQLAHEAAAKSKDDVRERELQLQKLQRDLEVESGRAQEAVSAAERQCAEQARRLEEQAVALRAAHESELLTAQHKISQLENEKAELLERCGGLESSVRKQESEVERLKAEMDRRETVGVEIARALEEARRQREELQQQVATLTPLLEEKDQLIADQTAALVKGEEELQRLRQGHDSLLLQMRHSQSSLELCQRQAVERAAAAGEQTGPLQERLLVGGSQAPPSDPAPLRKPLRPSEDTEAEPNGEVSALDVLQLQKDNGDLEQQVAEKSKVIKQLQQRITELKKTLQKELPWRGFCLGLKRELCFQKIRPDGEAPEVPSAALTVTNNADLNDSREINFEYLKHVVLKFMSSRESEAFHLLKAVSVLLNFSPEEESMLKETLEYKMSWFGSKPSPRGSIRPSISGPRTPWL